MWKINEATCEQIKCYYTSGIKVEILPKSVQHEIPSEGSYQYVTNKFHASRVVGVALV